MIINELLAYAKHYMNSSTIDNIKRVIQNFYDDEEIVEAKKVLWSECPDDLGTMPERKSTERRKASVAHVDDIISALIKLDALNNIPEVLARNIDRLPDRQPEEINLLYIVQRIADLERTRAEHNETLTNLAIDVLSLKEEKPKDTPYKQALISISNNSDYEIVEKSSQRQDRPTIIPVAESSTDAQDRPTGPFPGPPIDPPVGQPPGPPSGTSGSAHPGSNTDPQHYNNGRPTSHAELRDVNHRPAFTSHRRSLRPGRGGGHHRSRSGSRGRGTGRGAMQGRPQRPWPRAPPARGPALSSTQRRPQVDEDGFTLVTSKRRVVMGRRNTPTSGLEGAPPPRRIIFVSRVKCGDIETVSKYMTDNGVKVNNIQKMSHAESKFSSYKVSITKDDFSKVFDELFWPYGVQCKMWRDKIAENNPHKNQVTSGGGNNDQHSGNENAEINDNDDNEYSDDVREGE